MNPLNEKYCADIANCDVEIKLRTNQYCDAISQSFRGLCDSLQNEKDSYTDHCMWLNVKKNRSAFSSPIGSLTSSTGKSRVNFTDNPRTDGFPHRLLDDFNLESAKLTDWVGQKITNFALTGSVIQLYKRKEDSKFYDVNPWQPIIGTFNDGSKYDVKGVETFFNLCVQNKAGHRFRSFDMDKEKYITVGIAPTAPVVCKDSENRWGQLDNEGRVMRIPSSNAIWAPEVAGKAQSFLAPEVAGKEQQSFLRANIANRKAQSFLAQEVAGKEAQSLFVTSKGVTFEEDHFKHVQGQSRDYYTRIFGKNVERALCNLIANAHRKFKGASLSREEKTGIRSTQAMLTFFELLQTGDGFETCYHKYESEIQHTFITKQTIIAVPEHIMDNVKVHTLKIIGDISNEFRKLSEFKSSNTEKIVEIKEEYSNNTRNELLKEIIRFGNDYSIKIEVALDDLKHTFAYEDDNVVRELFVIFHRKIKLSLKEYIACIKIIADRNQQIAGRYRHDILIRYMTDEAEDLKHRLRTLDDALVRTSLHNNGSPSIFELKQWFDYVTQSLTIVNTTRIKAFDVLGGQGPVQQSFGVYEPIRVRNLAPTALKQLGPYQPEVQSKKDKEPISIQSSIRTNVYLLLDKIRLSITKQK